jgi:serine acetyltransferase
MSDDRSLGAVFRSLQRDASAYADLGGWYRNVGFWIGATYRGRRWARSLRSRAIQVSCLIPLRAVSLGWSTILNVQIEATAQIGAGLCLIHPRNIRIPATEIGENCTIFHEVTIGTNANSACFPRIGNNVCLYVGSRVLGAILVGDHAKIGANCVVTSNVPAGAVVVLAANRVVPAELVRVFGPT